MKSYDIDALVKDIRIILDQNQISSQLIAVSDIDTLSVNEIIKSKIAVAARVIETNAPISMLDGITLGSEETQSDGTIKTSYTIAWKSAIGIGMGSILLPDDFMRLIVFQMSDWNKPATIITEDDPKYEMQSSRYPGVRGCPQKPIAAIVLRSGGLTLELYSCTAGSSVTVKHGRYIPIPSIMDGSITLCVKLVDSIEYYAAYLACTELCSGETNKINLLRAHALDLANIETKQNNNN
jgi:hypothetical protein